VSEDIDVGLRGSGKEDKGKGKHNVRIDDTDHAGLAVVGLRAVVPDRGCVVDC